MDLQNRRGQARPPDPGAGQVVLPPAASNLAPVRQIQNLNRLSDPALSELGAEELLHELLERVRDALRVDTVAILLLEGDSQQLVASAARGVEEEVEQGIRIPIGEGFAGRIASERAAIFIADLDHADIVNPILREKGIRSLLGVPLIVEGDLIGVLHVGSLRPRTFGERDLAVLQVAAARAAPGIERAWRFSVLEREHRVAVVLQRSLLPRRLVDVVGVSVAARYLPARDEVGGDWYDVIELPHGLLGVAIGDVVGHGIKAAALMGQLRTALHSYAIRRPRAGANARARRPFHAVDGRARDGDGRLRDPGPGLGDASVLLGGPPPPNRARRWRRAGDRGDPIGAARRVPLRQLRGA